MVVERGMRKARTEDRPDSRWQSEVSIGKWGRKTQGKEDRENGRFSIHNERV